MNTADLRCPFYPEPVRTPMQFFDRKEETREALELLCQRQNISVEGPAKTGKTSFLLHVAHPQVRAQYGLAEEQVFVHLDSRSLAGHDQSQCYLAISEEIVRQARSTESVGEAIGIALEKAAREAGSEPAYLRLRTLCQAAQDNGLKLVLVLDDFEFLADRFRSEYRFFSALRALFTNYQVAYLIASQLPLHALEQTIPEASPFFNYFHPIILKSLTAEESREMVVTLLGRAGVELPRFSVDCILELGKGEPYRLKKALHIAFKVWQDSQGQLKTKHCEEIKKRFGENERHTESS